MSLSDGEVAVLADQVGELVRSWFAGRDVEVRVVPETNEDPYRWPDAGAWTVHFDVASGRDGRAAVTVPGDEEPVSALFRLVDGLDQLGPSFPRCRSGHDHRSQVVLDTDDNAVQLTCPETGEVLHRLTPIGEVEADEDS